MFREGVGRREIPRSLLPASVCFIALLTIVSMSTEKMPKPSAPLLNLSTINRIWEQINHHNDPEYWKKLDGAGFSKYWEEVKAHPTWWQWEGKAPWDWR